jgi:23S rRNA (cytidine1920-2'-O)/16S rRNA (cytidine1409-2'-O)-methyltransferase
MRLDKKLVELGLVETRNRAQLLIDRGAVKVNGMTTTKASLEILENDLVDVQNTALKYVSIGGEKLEIAIHQFNIMFDRCRVLDAGASTGGFTDCALKHGASLVYAVDVGTGQMDVKLKADKRVKSLENKDVRDLTLSEIDGIPVDIVLADLSFISLYKVLPKFKGLLKPGGKLVALVKPQFEQIEKHRTKGGIIKSERLRDEALERVTESLEMNGFRFENSCPTDADGKTKNIEYLVLAISVVSP